jgi:hypothetical protein
MNRLKQYYTCENAFGVIVFADDAFGFDPGDAGFVNAEVYVIVFLVNYTSDGALKWLESEPLNTASSYLGASHFAWASPCHR